VRRPAPDWVGSHRPPLRLWHAIVPALAAQLGEVYLDAIGGAATLIAESVKEVVDVHKLDFGVPEAFWEIRVEDFPAVVTMDSHGNSLHEKVRAESERKLQELLAG
jgi:fumarate hydratase subunit beta